MKEAGTDKALNVLRFLLSALHVNISPLKDYCRSCSLCHNWTGNDTTTYSHVIRTIFLAICMNNIWEEKSKVLLWLQDKRWCRCVQYFCVLKGEMRPLLCQCYYKQPQGLQQPFSFVNIFPDLMFSSEPCLYRVCCNRALHPQLTLMTSTRNRPNPTAHWL